MNGGDVDLGLELLPVEHVDLVVGQPVLQLGITPGDKSTEPRPSVSGHERATLVLIGIDALGLKDVQHRVDAGDELLLQRPARLQPTTDTGEGGTISRRHCRKPATVAP
ncbi:hypothetical protein STSP_04290 [Streptomyces jeddahensis]|uniref:Uncharacterized protein n=1 Tax=Streptomyces jeddahensis TaxID=1716141 RepID=A0A177I1H8_9ACTN|nr:hypothetical protein STSP_04290 [Streptomyces jeddahensis]